MDRVSALQEVDVALAELADADQLADKAHAKLEAAVRRAHFDAKVPQAELGRRVRRHRNTIATWCKK